MVLTEEYVLVSLHETGSWDWWSLHATSVRSAVMACGYAARQGQLDAYTMDTQWGLRRPGARRQGHARVAQGWHDFTLWGIDGVTLFRNL